MSEVVAVIPARGGSKGIVRKNLRPFRGQPLVAHSILAGLNCAGIDRVYVSTEDAEIAAVARDFGARVIDRPGELASDTASTFSVVRHAAEVLGFPEVIVTLQPTSPLRTSRQIGEGLDLLTPEVETVVGVCASHRYHWRLQDGYGVPEFRERRPRQQMKGRYLENGALYVSRKEVYKRNDSILGMGITSTGKVRLYIMDEIMAFEIDSEMDFIRLEQLYELAKQRGEL